MSDPHHDTTRPTDDHDRPTVDQPLNAEPRPRVTPLLAVLALLVVVALVFALITWTRYST